MTATVNLALEIRRRFSQPGSERRPVGVVVINDVTCVLDYDPADRPALEALGARCL